MNIRTALLVCPLVTLAACSDTETDSSSTSINAADLIVVNAAVHTMETSQATATAVAIRDGKYIYVGDRAGAEALANADTQVLDAQQRMLMPGINDSHQHPIEGGTKELFECTFPFTAGPEEISSKLTACVEAQPDSDWIRGGQFSSDFFVDHPMPSPRLWLDAISSDKAIVLVDDAYHNAWMNSKALAELGVSKPEDLPHGVEMALDQEGKFDGFMIEAFGFLKDNVHWSPEQYAQAAAHAVKLANGFGITGLKATAIGEAELKAFKQLGDEGKLSAHVAGAIGTPYGHREEPLNISVYTDLRDRYKAPNFNTNFIKIFMDGVPTAARTAAMLAPYTAAKEGDERSDGQLHIAADILDVDVVALDAAGFTIKIHTAGDRSVRVALDAIEKARKANGTAPNRRHELAHAGYVDNADMGRFAALNAIPDFSPYIWFPSPIMDSVLTAVGERGEFYWPTKTLLATGAELAPGSDWPAAVPSMNPWPGIEALVTRADPFANTNATLWADEAVSVQQALQIFTVNGSRALMVDEQSGSIAVGKSADFIVLNQNLFDIEPQKISDTQVVMTYFAGKQVYSQP
ncbi:MAG: amidohydrolase [Pseudomonadales bacterium]